MNDLLIRIGVMFIASTICLPLAYLGISHGSSFGLESGVSLIILNIIIVGYMAKLKGKGNNNE